MLLEKNAAVDLRGEVIILLHQQFLNIFRMETPPYPLPASIITTPSPPYYAMPKRMLIFAILMDARV